MKKTTFSYSLCSLFPYACPDIDTSCHNLSFRIHWPSCCYIVKTFATCVPRSSKSQRKGTELACFLVKTRLIVVVVIIVQLRCCPKSSSPSSTVLSSQLSKGRSRGSHFYRWTRRHRASQPPSSLTAFFLFFRWQPSHRWSRGFPGRLHAPAGNGQAGAEGCRCTPCDLARALLRVALYRGAASRRALAVRRTLRSSLHPRPQPRVPMEGGGERTSGRFGERASRCEGRPLKLCVCANLLASNHAILPVVGVAIRRFSSITLCSSSGPLSLSLLLPWAISLPTKISEVIDLTWWLFWPISFKNWWSGSNENESEVSDLFFKSLCFSLFLRPHFLLRPFFLLFLSCGSNPPPSRRQWRLVESCI